MSDWEPSSKAVKVAFEIIDCRSDDTLTEAIVRAAMIAAHAVAEQDGATLVLREREECAKVADDCGVPWTASRIRARSLPSHDNPPKANQERDEP